MSLNPFGINTQWDSFAILLNSMLSGMGDYLTKDVGSIAWCKAATYAQAHDTDFNFMKLMAEQIQPTTSSVYVDDWANIYGVQGLSNINQIKQQIALVQQFTGTYPTLNNVRKLLQFILPNIFIDIIWLPENQYLASGININQAEVNAGFQYKFPLATLYVYVWQPRDNQDNLLMPNTQFNNLVDSYLPTLRSWLPSYTEIITMNLVNRGNEDGYGGGYNGLNYNNYLDGYNVVSGSAGSTSITGTNTTFNLDFFPSTPPTGPTIPNCIPTYPPLQVVDDTNTLQTYYVMDVNSPTSITLTSPLINSVTNRTYKTLGIVCDTPGILDGGSLYNH